MPIPFSSREIIKGGNNVNANSLYIPFCISPVHTHGWKKSVWVIGKTSVKTATCIGIMGRNWFLFQWSQVSPEILTAKGQCQLFAEACTIGSIRQQFEPSAPPNNRRIAAFIFSNPAFIVCHCFLELFRCQYLKNRILSGYWFPKDFESLPS